MKKKYKTFTKRIATLTLTALIVFSSVFSSYSMTANAEVNLNLNLTPNDLVLLDLIEAGLVTAGEVAGAAIGTMIVPGPGTILGGLAGGVVTKTAINSSLNKTLDWFVNPSGQGQVTVPPGQSNSSIDNKRINYYVNNGKETTQNTTNFNQTKNMSLYNETKTWNNTTNKYDYTYNWYNPVTNNYDVTNNYTYNSTYNTYHYQTYDIDVTNNYNYTTNYYIQDNRTYVTYYIVNQCAETNEKEETIVNMYYQLPDGRNSLDLTVDDIKGMYFPSNYSKYISVAEDDGTTLGLWHLDGDLKDSSYWGNTAGSSYQNVYTDGLYSTGKKFSSSKSDFMELKLDKVDLPSSWTLEWCEYVASSEIICSYTGSAQTAIPNYDRASGYYDEEIYDINYDINITGYLGIDSDVSYTATNGYFIPYALVCNNGQYSFYMNGSKVSSSASTNFSVSVPYDYGKSSGTWNFNLTDNEQIFSGIKVANDSIRFYAPSEPYKVSRNSSSYVVGEIYSSSDGSKYYYRSHPVWNYYQFPHKNAIIDEVRLSSGVLYSGSSYTPLSQPYTTNTVLAVPDNPEKHEIAFKTNTNISDVRFGGARPTYPTNGYVYVALDSDHVVESIQQYQEDGWYEIESAIYLGTDWVDYKGFDMDYLGIDVPDSDSGGSGDTGGGSGGGSDSGDTGDTGNNGDSGGGTGIGDIIDGIVKFLDTILSLIGKLIGIVSDFVSSALSLFETLTVFTDGFSQFLSGAFGFLPPEAITVIVSGITTIVILAIIKFLRG